MTHESWDIDQLVREVVRRLNETRGTGVASVAAGPALSSRSAPSTAAATAPVATALAGEWQVASRLVTLETLAGRPAAARLLKVARGTVVTPAARDQLRQWGIDVQFVDAKSATAASPAANKGKLYLHGATGTGISPAFVRSLANLGWAIESLVAAPLPQAVAELAAVLTDPARIGVLLVSERDLALCLANRWSNVRAVSATDKRNIKAAVRDWGANLLVLDPRPVSVPTLRGVVEAFAECGPRSCPAEWKKYFEK